MKRIQTKKSRRISIFIVLGVILAVAMITQLAFLTVFGTRGNEVAQIRSEEKNLILENELLKAEICKEQSLKRIKEIAVEQLGMTSIGEVEYLTPASSLTSSSK